MAKEQAGILNRPPDHLVVAALNLTTADPEAARAAVARLREIVHRELRSDLDDTTPQSPKDQPSTETGELGFTDRYDRYHLTITVGLAKSAFDKLGIPGEDQPQDLIAIPWSQFGDAPDVPGNGDIALQICTDSLYIAEHVLRRVGEELEDVVSLAWAVDGHQRHNSRPGRVSRDEGRALIGFLDGTANLDPKHETDHRRLVFVDPEIVDSYPPRVPAPAPGQPNPYGGPQLPVFPDDLRAPPTREPTWTKNGTYMVVRASTIDMSTWDNLPLGEQERVIGRFKVSGNALDQTDDPSTPISDPNLAGDPEGTITALASHIRKANPRGGAEDQDRRIFRRGYPLLTANTIGVQRGLVFVCFARTITAQFEFITRAWTVNPDFPRPGTGPDLLRAFEHVLCGGYFFVPPLSNGNQPWSWIIP